MRTLFPALVIGLAGCSSGGAIGYDGYHMDSFFPFDGERTWRFENTDTSLGYYVDATLNSEFTDSADGSRVYAVDYAKTCFQEGCVEGSLEVSQIGWSSDGEGTRFHSAVIDGTPTAFEPPIAVTLDQSVIGDTVDTETAGTTFHSEFVDIGDCPVLMSVDWTDCVKLTLTDADGGLTHPLHGDIYAITSFNMIAFQRTGDPGQWQLLDTEFTASE